MEDPVCGDPKGAVLPNGLGAKGLLLALLVWPKIDWDPKGLLEDCPKGLLDDCPNGLLDDCPKAAEGISNYN